MLLLVLLRTVVDSLAAATHKLSILLTDLALLHAHAFFPLGCHPESIITHSQLMDMGASSSNKLLLAYLER
jgi:hypothetical protein